jgi:hypothetical protein
MTLRIRRFDISTVGEEIDREDGSGEYCKYDDLKLLIAVFKKIQNDNDIAINCIMDHLHIRLVKDETKPFGYRCIEIP